MKTIVHLGSHYDETGQLADWHINRAHYLESWSDARAYDGTVCVMQPMIDPLYGGHSAHEIVQSLLDNPDLSAYEAVRETWKDKTAGTPRADFEFGWRKALHDGFIADTAFSRRRAAAARLRFRPRRTVSRADTLEIVFRPDPNVYDGRYRERRLAAGSAAAGNESLLGQRRADELRHA